MKKQLNSLCYVKIIKDQVIVIVVVAVCFTVLMARCVTETSANFNVKQVIIEGTAQVPDQYSKGKYLFPSFQRLGLPDTFLIKNAPDLSFTPHDIRAVEFITNTFDRSGSGCTIRILFSPTAAEKLRKYTQNKIGKLVALEINRKIIGLVKILDPTSNIAIMSVSKQDSKNIVTLFKQCGFNVVVRKTR